MSEIRYTQEELEEALAFIRDRLRNEQSMSADLRRLLEEYARMLLIILFSGKIADGDEFANALAGELLADCYILAMDEHDRREEVLAYMSSERNGETLQERVRKRARTFFDEVVMVYTAGKLLGKNMNDVLTCIVNNMKDPWESNIVKEAREKIAAGKAASDYDFEKPHYGRGVEADSFGSLETILIYAIGDAWMWWGYEYAKSRGALGYYIERGSSYPCDICDSHCGIFFPISDKSNLPQFHAHCCCCVVYSYVDRV